jgi:hypothetical protein
MPPPVSPELPATVQMFNVKVPPLKIRVDRNPETLQALIDRLEPLSMVMPT